MKDGRTHLAYKAEHAVDLDTGAIVGVTVQPADRGDTESVYTTLSEANDQLKEATGRAANEVVLDKGFHCDDVLATLTALDLRTYVSEPKRGRRRWRGRLDVQRAVYNNRRRVRGGRGRELLRRRGELLERPFAHVLDTGGDVVPGDSANSLLILAVAGATDEVSKAPVALKVIAIPGVDAGEEALPDVTVGDDCGRQRAAGGQDGYGRVQCGSSGFAPAVIAPGHGP